MNYWPGVLDQIQQNTGLSFDHPSISRVSGGCINNSFLISDGQEQVFVKTNRSEYLTMFEAEANGLKVIAESNAIRVPHIMCTGLSGKTAFIVMQAIRMGRAHAGSYREFGQQLATMHRYQNTRFGSSIDNTIGSTPQHNPWSDDWFEFWRKYRLGFQLNLALENNASSQLIDDGLRLNDSFDALFERQPNAACLHGDLWQGNWGFDYSGKVAIFDPAHYFGDRETDLAMTSLFGRAHADFYAAYQETYPLKTGYTIRESFYNIYHILNHFNLFGGAYAAQAHDMIKIVLSELR